MKLAIIFIFLLVFSCAGGSRHHSSVQTSSTPVKAGPMVPVNTRASFIKVQPQGSFFLMPLGVGYTTTW
jgi:hypothetical protein